MSLHAPARLASKSLYVMKSWEDKAALYVLVGFLFWCSLESQVYRSSTVALYLGRGVPAVVMVIFALYLAKSHTGFGRLGTSLRRVCILIIASYGVSYLLSGLKILGSEEISRFWLFRLSLILLTGLVSYRLAHLRFLTSQALMFCCVAILVILIVSALYAEYVGLEPEISYRNLDQATGLGGMIISGYLLAFCLPGLILLRQDLLRYSMIGLCLAAVALTYKKGALACAFLALVFPMLRDQQGRFRIQLRSLKKRLMGTAIIIAILFIIVVTFGFAQLTRRWAELYEGNPRGLSMRDQIWPVLFKGILTDTDCLIFGHGIGSTVLATEQSLGLQMGRYAHNDWLEITYTAGLMGLVSFVLLHLILIKSTWYLCRANSEVSTVALTAYGLFVSASIVSGIMYAFQCTSLLFGILGAVCAWAEDTVESHNRRHRVS